MALEITENSIASWQAFAQAAQFVPDPMILRTGEVFANGARGAHALDRPDMEVLASLKDNIGGLIEFFDMVVVYDQVPIINYVDTFDMNSMPTHITTLLGPKALPVSIGYQAYSEIRDGALAALSRIDLNRITRFGQQLAELDSLRYDWRPNLASPEGWLAQAAQLDESTRRAAEFLLGGLIFSGFAQASLTDHVIQPKRSRFFLAITGAAPIVGGVSRADEDGVFDAAEAALEGTGARVRRLDALPPVLPYLLAKAPPNVTAGDLLQRALDFANTREGEIFRKAVGYIRGDGASASQAADLADAAKAEALALLRPYATLADPRGGLKVDFKAEAGLSLDGPKAGVSMAVSKTLTPAWLQAWWNERVAFGGLRKTFRRMWMEAEGFRDLETRILTVWAQS